MDRIDGAWSRERAEQFLTDRAIPVRVACRTPAGELWMLSLWYRYDEGTLECATRAGADVVTYLRSDPSVAFEVSTNRPPYMGVRGTGVASISPDDEKTVLRSLVERYVGDTDSGFARWLLSPDRDEVAVTVDVDRVYTWDFSDRMPHAGE